MKRFFVIIILSTFLCVVILLLYTNVSVLQWGNLIADDIEKVPSKSVGLIFGGGMKENGTMSDMQYDRVQAGILLYKEGKIDKLVMTGDDGKWRFNEVDAMHDMAVAAGVPDGLVDIDPHGYNTYRSCYRAKNEFGIEEVVAVSQKFHLYRILYFCNTFGIDTVGYPADVGPYGLIGTVRTMWLRESLARVKGWWQVEISQPEY